MARASEIIVVGPLQIVPEEHLARVDGRALMLSIRELRLLTELARHLGRTDDPIVRQRLAEVHTVDFLIRKVGQRGDDLRAATGAERGASEKAATFHERPPSC